MAHRFTCGESKIWQNIKKSQNIMKMIAVSKVSVGVNYKDSIYAQLCLKLQLWAASYQKAIGIFVI